MFDPFPTLGQKPDEKKTQATSMEELVAMLQANPELAGLLAGSNTLDERGVLAEKQGRTAGALRGWVPPTALSAGISAAGEGIGAITRLLGNREQSNILDQKDKVNQAYIDALEAKKRAGLPLTKEEAKIVKVPVPREWFGGAPVLPYDPYGQGGLS